MAYSQPYLYDFESSIAYSIAICRLLISRGCFAFSSSLSASLTTTIFPLSLGPPVWFSTIYLSFTSLAIYSTKFGVCVEAVNYYQTLFCSIGITSLSMAQSFYSWWNVKFDELLSYCLPTVGKRIICWMCIHKFTLFLSSFPFLHRIDFFS